MIEISLRPGVSLSEDSSDAVAVQRGACYMRLTGLDSSAVKFLLDLAQHPLRIDNSEEPMAAPRGNGRTMKVVLARLAERRLIGIDCVVGGRKLLSARLTNTLSSFDFSKKTPAQPVQLSRFAYLRRVDGSLIIESPVCLTTVLVCEPSVAGLLAELATARPVGKLGRGSALQPEEIHECVRFLLGVGVLDIPDAAGMLAEDTIPALAQREFHDVVLHTHSRLGLTEQSLGGAFPFSGTLPPLPAIKQPMAEQPAGLPKPDIAKLVESDVPFAMVMERRRSVRHFGADPITVEQLGEFLYRVARVRAVRTPCPGTPRGYETSNRPYPSGGAMYDLELYLTVRRCSGLKPGTYHYEPLEHALSMICDKTSLNEEIINGAAHSGGGNGTPHVVITLASRFSRLGWKYRGICYSLTLKNVGVLYEAMYLAATAMNLAPCALGNGDSAMFARVTGLDPLLESSVGEFMLGTLPSGARR